LVKAVDYLALHATPHCFQENVNYLDDYSLMSNDLWNLRIYLMLVMTQTEQYSCKQSVYRKRRAGKIEPLWFTTV
jgi:hypothetical protein